MKRMLALIGLFTLALTVQAQKKTSGAIQYETTTDPAAMATANGIQLSEEMRARMPKAMKTNFELLFTATHASYMPVTEFEDSNNEGGGGGMGRMMMRFGGAGGVREYFYTFADQKLVEVFDLNDTTYAMPSKLTVAANIQPGFNAGGAAQRPGTNATTTNSAVQFLPGPPTMEVVKTDETKKILGFNAHKVIVKSIRKAKVLDMDKDIIDETVVWYTTELGFNFSPNPNLWTEGAVLAIENKGNTTLAKSIEYRNVSARDVTVPKKVVAITAEEYQAKMEAMINRMRGGNSRPGQTSGQARSIILN